MFGNPETTTGGRALKFYASVRLDIRRIASLKEGDVVVGSRAKVKVVKNKVAPPFREAEFDILYGEGISKEGDLLDLGVDHKVIEKSGAWYAFNGERMGQGRENARQFLKDNKDIRQEIDRAAAPGPGPAGARRGAGRGRPRARRARSSRCRRRRRPSRHRAASLAGRASASRQPVGRVQPRCRSSSAFALLRRLVRRLCPGVRQRQRHLAVGPGTPRRRDAAPRHDARREDRPDDAGRARVAHAARTTSPATSSARS